MAMLATNAFGAFLIIGPDVYLMRTTGHKGHSAQWYHTFMSWPALQNTNVSRKKDGAVMQEVRSSYKLEIDYNSGIYATFLRQSKKFSKGKHIHAEILLVGIEVDAFLGSHILEMYIRYHSLEDALEVFCGMHIFNTSLWNTLIEAYIQDGQDKEATSLFWQMKSESVKPDKYTFVTVLSARLGKAESKWVHAHALCCNLWMDALVATALLRVHSKFGDLVTAASIFDRIKQKDLVSWNVLIGAHVQNDQSIEAIRLFMQLQLESIKPDKFTFMNMINAYSKNAELYEINKVHSQILCCGLNSDVILCNALVSAYGRCGSVEDAGRVFASISRPDVVSWTAMIAACIEHNFCKCATQLFKRMQLIGIVSNNVTFITVLDACSLSGGKLVHSQILKSGQELDSFFGTALIKMYGKYSLESAVNAFCHIPWQNVVPWNAMLAAFAQNGQGMGALFLFRKMQAEHVQPDKTTFISVFHACTSLGSLVEGRKMHNLFLDSKLDLDVVVGATLLHMYGRCQCIADACSVFDNMCLYDIVVWNAMIAAYAQNGDGKMALQILEQMKVENEKPNKISLTSSIDACMLLSSPAKCRWLHAHILVNDFSSDIPLGNAVINMYAQAGEIANSLDVFTKMPHRDVISWTSMLASYAQNDCFQKSMLLFHAMQYEGVIPNEVTFIILLDACANLTSLTEGMRIHDYIVNGEFVLEISMSNALINMYGKCRSVKNAERVFRETPVRNLFTWNSMLAAYNEAGYWQKSIVSFWQMHCQGVFPDKVSYIFVLDACMCLESVAKATCIHAHAIASGLESDVVVGNAIINAYFKCGAQEHGSFFFSKMSIRDVVTWNTMFVNCMAKEVLEVFPQMDVIPDKTTYTILLDVCASVAALGAGKALHARVTECGFDLDTVVGTALINMYGKCGSLAHAEGLFEKMPDSDIVLWAIMITIYGLNGQGLKALHLFHRIHVQGMMPNEVILVSSLTACSHACLVNEASHLFVSMGQIYLISTRSEHYGCMIDLFGRAGWLDEAINLICSMSVTPAMTSWMALLGAHHERIDL